MTEVTLTSLRDKCNRLDGLLTCLQLVVSTDEFKRYHSEPHAYLFSTISEGIQEIETELKRIDEESH